MGVNKGKILTMILVMVVIAVGMVPVSAYGVNAGASSRIAMDQRILGQFPIYLEGEITRHNGVHRLVGNSGISVGTIVSLTEWEYEQTPEGGLLSNPETQSSMMVSLEDYSVRMVTLNKATGVEEKDFGLFRIHRVSAGISGIENLYVPIESLLELFDLGAVFHNKKVLHLYDSMDDAKVAYELLGAVERFKRQLKVKGSAYWLGNRVAAVDFYINPLKHQEVIIKHSILTGSEFVSENGNLNRRLILDKAEKVVLRIEVSSGDSVQTETIEFSLQPRRVANGRDYDWYFSQHGTGSHSDANCGQAALAMILKWTNEDMKKTVSSIRREMGHHGGTEITQMKDYLRDHEIGFTQISITDVEKLKKRLDKGEIILATVSVNTYYQNNNGGYHYILIWGYKLPADGRQDTILYVQDPWSSTKEIKAGHFFRSAKNLEFLMLSISDIKPQPAVFFFQKSLF